MTDAGSSSRPYILWGTPHSLYTGKARSYLIKKGLAFRERCPSDPRYKQQVLPAVGLVTFPVLQTPEGTFIQDSTDIVEHLEAHHPLRPMTPQAPVQRLFAQLLDGFGLEGLLATAMHYRWSYRAQQEHFLRAEFGRGLYNGADRDKRAAAGERTMAYMSGALPALGVTPEAIPAIEAAFEELLDALDVHFQAHPYVLGAHPSIADFGLMAPMFAHLGRDPVPASLMKNRAPNVYRWVERMNLPTLDDGEYPEGESAWPPDDAIPVTLEPVLALVFRDWGLLLQADAAAYNAWLDNGPARASGDRVSADDQRRVHPTLGPVEVLWRGRTVRRASAVHGLWMFDKVARSVHALAPEARTRLEDLLQRTGGASVMSTRLHRAMERRDNVLVLA